MDILKPTLQCTQPTRTQPWPGRCTDPTTPTRALVIVGCVILSILLLWPSPASAAARGSITLRSNARATGDTITLDEIARLEGDAAQDLADTQIATFATNDDAPTISLSKVRKTLKMRNLNWSRLTLAGHLRCHVRHISESGNRANSHMTPKPRPRPADGHSVPAKADARLNTPTASVPPPSSDKKTSGAATSNSQSAVSVNKPTTLRELVVGRLAKHADRSPDELRITFSKADRKRLNRGLLGQRYSLKALSRSRLGRIPVRIRRYDGLQVAERFTVRPTVQWRTLGIVAAKPVRRGQSLTSGNMTKHEILLDDDTHKPLTDTNQVLGQDAASMLDVGEPLFTDDVQSPVLVQRGDRITVRCLSGDLVVRTVGRARADGTRGQTIEVRNLSSGQTFQALVTGRREVAISSSKRASNPKTARATRSKSHAGDS